MTSGGNPQERIRQIMQKIDAELSAMRLLETGPKKPTKCFYTEDAKSIDNSVVSGPDTSATDAYKQRVIRAYKQRKIFTVYGNYATIRRALIRRGWIEKCAPGRNSKLETLPLDRLVQAARSGNVYETAILSKLVQNYPPNFIWQPKSFKDQYVNLVPYRNRVRRNACLDFSTKVGLIGCIENSHWNVIENVAEVSLMPSYKLSTREEELHFLQDFRLTACLSVLIFFVEHKAPAELFDLSGTVAIEIFEFAKKHVQAYINEVEEDDIEIGVWSDDESQWENFTVNAGLLTKNNQKICGSEADCLKILEGSEQTLKKALKYRPYLHSYGFKNLWILKPGFQCRGQGITIMDNFFHIVNFAAKKPKSNYVVQKYIERPFLIYKTKFDIRQYMLLTVFDVISVWMYEECYLRFSSREFSLGDLRESVHLTNNSIQKKYKNAERDPKLPMHNMWNLSQFQSYLTETGQGEVWNNKIYPGFKRNIIAIVLASLEETHVTPNTFELYGCDFMLDEKLDPFLIEINSTPDLSPSTPVTAKFCPLALEDLMKVVLDYPKHQKVSTGKFELIYQVNCPRECNTAADLIVVGRPAKMHSTPVARSKKGKIKRILKRKILGKCVAN